MNWVKQSEGPVHICFSKKAFLQILQYSQENTCVAWNPATLLKRDPDTGAFLWVLVNF